MNLRFPTALELAVFICGAAVMMIEILGSRVLAPYFGSSLITWTCIIGVILAALSAGYYLGGKLADKKPTLAQFSFIIFLAGLSTAAVSLLSPYANHFFIFGPVGGPLIVSLMFFTIPSILLGMVSPYAVKLNTHALARVGSSAGSLYAISTLGSIVGTFATGFYLIPSFGVRSILLATSAMLLLLPILLMGRRQLPLAFASILIILLINSFAFPASASTGTLYEADSAYYHVRVIQEPGSSVRTLYLDRQLASAKYLDSDDFFAKYMACTQLAFKLHEEIENMPAILFLGLGGGIEPTYVRSHYPSARVDVVELDPLLLEISKDYFGFSEDARLKVEIGDARTALADSKMKYDIIRIDVFNSHDSVPFHLTTTETLQEVKAHLNEDGLVITNIISTLEGPYSDFFRAEYKTYKENFKRVAVIAISPTYPRNVQNIVLIGTDGNAEITKEKLLALAGEDMRMTACANGFWTAEPETHNVPLLTDDYAPVERMIAQLSILELLNAVEGQ